MTGTDRSTATVSRLPEGPTGRPRPIALGRATATSPDDLAVGAGAVWATVADALYRADPARLGAAVRVAALPRAGLLSGVAVGAGYVWVADSTRRTVNRVDPDGRRATVTVPLPASADGVAVGEGAVWVPSGQGQSVFRIGPGALAWCARSPSRARRTEWLRAPEACGSPRRRVTRSPASTPPPAACRGSQSATPRRTCALARGSVWVANSGSGTVSRIDPTSGRVAATIEVPARPNRIATDGRSVWATFLGPPPGGD